MSMKSSRNFQPWINRIGIGGLIVTVFYFLIQAIAEDEIQGWWQSHAKPFLGEPVVVELNKTFPRWFLGASIVIFALIIVGLIYTFIRLYKNERDARMQLQKQTLGVPIAALEKVEVTNLDVTNAVTFHRRQEINDIDLATVVIYAANAGVITREAADDALIETPFRMDKHNGVFIFVPKSVVWR